MDARVWFTGEVDGENGLAGAAGADGGLDSCKHGSAVIAMRPP